VRKTTLILLVATLAGCNAGNSATNQIGTVNVSRITSNWPKFLNYQNQLGADAQAIDRSRDPESTKARQRADLQQRFQQFQDDVTNDVRSAAQQVAADKHLKLVVTREFIGYGGVDITSDVEKILKITETATPKP
jgi:Skp family chaperone for outer membrane proteins